jgi:uncharacterized protein (DUF2141 family)
MNRKRFFRIGIFLLLVCSAMMIGACQTQAQAVSNLTVRVTGIRNAKGNIRSSLYRDGQFVEDRQAEIDPKTLTATIVFEKIPQGVYTVQLMHDENLNGKMDKNLLGIPQEGYGMSNNPKKRMGKPGFDETNFQVNQPALAIEIMMIYW